MSKLRRTVYGRDARSTADGLVELAVLGCHEEDGVSPEAFAAMIHQMRQATDHPVALALPLPLHLAKLAQEYVLPTRAEDDEDTSDLSW